MKPDEQQLWDALWQGEWPRYAGARLGIHPKRVVYLCHKWAAKDRYDYGVAADLGWPEMGPHPISGRRAKK